VTQVWSGTIGHFRSARDSSAVNQPAGRFNIAECGKHLDVAQSCV
jgi:hypothetical protein